MTKKARLIYNPVSGHEQMPKNVADILDVLEQAGYEASAFRTTPEKRVRKMRQRVRLKQVLICWLPPVVMGQSMKL